VGLHIPAVRSASQNFLRLPKPALRGVTDYSILEPFSAGQIGVPRGAKHVIGGIGTAPGSCRHTTATATATASATRLADIAAEGEGSNELGAMIEGGHNVCGCLGLFSNELRRSIAFSETEHRLAACSIPAPITNELGRTSKLGADRAGSRSKPDPQATPQATGQSGC
jgi:hypothetical protein